jgi:hypothetical protein
VSSDLQYNFTKKLTSTYLFEDAVKGIESVKRCVDILHQRGRNSAQLRPDGIPGEIFASRTPVLRAV